MSLDTIHIIVNPASGSRLAEQLYKEHVLPTIQSHAPTVKVVQHRTEATGDGVNVIKRILAASPADKELSLVLLGGDGTTHEVLNGLVVASSDSNAHSVPIPARIAVVPAGTANALYASLYAKQEGEGYEGDKLRSLRAMLTGKAETHPLALSAVTVGAQKGKEGMLAHLITSHALHASILSDSEALRSEHPGIERFKIAFGQNKAVWVGASVELEPLKSGKAKGKIQRYDPTSGTFVELDASSARFDDPILYFACVTTDRLEPSFVPAPYSGPVCDRDELRRPSDAVDIVLYRPLRNPALAQHKDAGQDFWIGSESEAIREKIAESHLMQISVLMYQEGKHIDLTYSNTKADIDGELECKGQGPVVCEYYRCAGYTWTAVSVA